MKTITQPTSSPWLIQSSAGNRRIIANAPQADGEIEQQTLAIVNCWLGVTPEQADANGALMAAAPELLSAVYDLLDIVQAEYANDPEPEDLPSWKRAIEQAEAAIAKAEGEK